MRLIAPHIQRAVLISKVIDLKQGEAASLAQAFDGLRAGVILVEFGRPRRARKRSCACPSQRRSGIARVAGSAGLRQRQGGPGTPG